MKNIDSTGFIISIDGPDGSGKTTQIRLLTEHLEHLGYKVHTTRANGGTPIGEELRKASLSNTERSAEVDLYISLALHTALGQDLQKRRQAGEIILIDRSPLSIIAYQNFGSRLADQESGYAACELMLRLWDIDQLFVFTIDESDLDTRNQRRAVTHGAETTNYFEKQDSGFKQRIHAGYTAAYEFAQTIPELATQITYIDANQSEKAVLADMIKRLPARLQT